MCKRNAGKKKGRTKEVKTSKNGHKADRLLSYKELKPPSPPPSKELSSRATNDIPKFIGGVTTRTLAL